MIAANDPTSFHNWQATLLERLVAIRGDEHHRDGIAQVQGLLATELEALGFTRPEHLREIHLRAERVKAEAPRVAFITHADTVSLPSAKTIVTKDAESGHWLGHGIADCRGGCVVMLGALKLLDEAGLSDRFSPWVMSCGDEETGTPSARDIFFDAPKLEAALVFEPARASGNIVNGRKGQVLVNLQFGGVAAHAGNNISDGANAIEAMAEFVLALREEMMGYQSATANVGTAKGGDAFNIVAPHAACAVDMRYRQKAERETFLRFIENFHPSNSRCSVSHSFGIDRPVWEPNNSCALADIYLGHARSLDLSLSCKSPGGGSDANWLASRDIPILDGLGPVGGGYHALSEFIDPATLYQRSQLAAQSLIDWLGRFR